jgi:hypothetical protein
MVVHLTTINLRLGGTEIDPDVNARMVAMAHLARVTSNVNQSLGTTEHMLLLHLPGTILGHQLPPRLHQRLLLLRLLPVVAGGHRSLMC